MQGEMIDLTRQLAYATIVIALASVATVVAAISASVAAWKAWKAAQGQLLLRLLDEYADPEMARALRMLRAWRDEFQAGFASVWIRAVRNREDPNWRRACEVELARRRVSHFFFKAHRLVDKGFCGKGIKEVIGSIEAIELLRQVVQPLEEEMRPGERARVAAEFTRLLRVFPGPSKPSWITEVPDCEQQELPKTRRALEAMASRFLKTLVNLPLDQPNGGSAMDAASIWTDDELMDLERMARELPEVDLNRVSAGILAMRAIAKTVRYVQRTDTRGHFSFSADEKRNWPAHIATARSALEALSAITGTPPLTHPSPSADHR